MSNLSNRLNGMLIAHHSDFSSFPTFFTFEVKTRLEQGRDLKDGLVNGLQLAVNFNFWKTVFPTVWHQISRDAEGGAYLIFQFLAVWLDGIVQMAVYELENPFIKSKQSNNALLHIVWLPTGFIHPPQVRSIFIKCIHRRKQVADKLKYFRFFSQFCFSFHFLFCFSFQK